MSDTNRFPLEHPENSGDVRTIAERAGVELRGEEGRPFCCRNRMQTKAGRMGTDYARCRKSGRVVCCMASPPMNEGIVWNKDIIELHGDSMSTTRPDVPDSQPTEG